jgi:D-glycero-D-manno-heptose 1,7-bisphosphate phosphatase
MGEIAVFLDRDGTIIEDRGYVCRFDPAAVFPQAPQAIGRFRERFDRVIVVTNQSSVARGICTETDIRAFHDQLSEYLRRRGAPLDAFYYCPYLKEGLIPEYARDHPWRKPSPGMILQAASDFPLDLARSFMIGDGVGDIIAGKRAGCRTVLVSTGHGSESAAELEAAGQSPDLLAADLLDAASLILDGLK